MREREKAAGPWRPSAYVPYVSLLVVPAGSGLPV